MNVKKPFLFKLQKGLLSDFLYTEASLCFYLPVNCALFLDT